MSQFLCHCIQHHRKSARAQGTVLLDKHACLKANHFGPVLFFSQTTAAADRNNKVNISCEPEDFSLETGRRHLVVREVKDDHELP